MTNMQNQWTRPSTPPPTQPAVGKYWRPKPYSRTGESRTAWVPRVPSKFGAIVVAALGVFLLYVTLELYRAWQDFSNIIVQAFTHRDGTIFGLLAIVAALFSAACFYGAVRLWRGDE